MASWYYRSKRWSSSGHTKEILSEEGGGPLGHKGGNWYPFGRHIGLCHELIDFLKPIPLSVKVLRGALNKNDYKEGFDSVIHSVASYIEVTIRHL